MTDFLKTVNHGVRPIQYFLADRRSTNGRTHATVLRLSVGVVVCTECVVAKQCVLEQKLLTAHSKSYMRNRLVPK